MTTHHQKTLVTINFEYSLGNNSTIQEKVPKLTHKEHKSNGLNTYVHRCFTTNLKCSQAQRNHIS
jgi:hypothetical protein